MKFFFSLMLAACVLGFSGCDQMRQAINWCTCSTSDSIDETSNDDTMTDDADSE